MIELFSPESYKVAGQAIKRVVCNGCGPKGFGSWFVPNTLWGLSIEESCFIHDWMYDEGKTIKDKEEADRVFLNNMVRIIDSESSAIFKAIRRQRAMKYYSAVMDFGGPAFWDGK